MIVAFILLHFVSHYRYYIIFVLCITLISLVLAGKTIRKVIVFLLAIFPLILQIVAIVLVRYMLLANAFIFLCMISYTLFLFAAITRLIREKCIFEFLLYIGYSIFYFLFLFMFKPLLYEESLLYILSHTIVVYMYLMSVLILYNLNFKKIIDTYSDHKFLDKKELRNLKNIINSSKLDQLYGYLSGSELSRMERLFLYIKIYDLKSSESFHSDINRDEINLLENLPLDYQTFTTYEEKMKKSLDKDENSKAFDSLEMYFNIVSSIVVKYKKYYHRVYSLISQLNYDQMLFYSHSIYLLFKTDIILFINHYANSTKKERKKLDMFFDILNEKWFLSKEEKEHLKELIEKYSHEIPKRYLRKLKI